MDGRFAEAVRDPEVRHDLRILADFTQLFCDAHHRDRDRRVFASGATALGVYGRKSRSLCGECGAHLRYGEARRAACPMNPKPFCSQCESHCYRPSEAAWHREMMRFSGPRSWSRGHLIDGIKHAMAQARARRREADGDLERSSQTGRGTVAREEHR